MAEEIPLVDIMKQAAQAMYLVQQGQAYQKQLKAPELQPSMAERFFTAKEGPIWDAHAGKRAQIALIKEQQKSLAKYFIASGQDELLSSVFVPMKDEELSAMSQKYMASVMKSTQAQRTVSQPYTEAMSPQGTLDFPTIGASRGAEMFKGLGSTQRPTTAPERSGKLNSALTDPDQASGMILAIQQYLGKDAAKAIQDQMQISQTAQAAQQKQQNIQSFNDDPPQAAPQAQPKPTGPPSAPQDLSATTSPRTSVRREAIVKQGTTMGLDPGILGAILGNEGGSPSAVSSKGAEGDLQVMPATALSEYGITAEQFKDPAIKNMAGLRYLRDLSVPGGKYYERTQGKPEAVMAAYFSGPGNVKDGKIINPDLHDGTQEKKGTTVAEYVASGMKRYNQTLASSQLGQETLTYAPLKNAGKRLGEGGGVSIDPDKARQERAEFNIDQTMNTDPLRIPDMLTLAGKHGGTPSPQRLQIYQDAYTRAAVQDALKTPNYALPLGERYQEAVTRAGQTNPQFFNTDLANKMIPASVTAQTQAQGTVVGTAQGKQSQAFRDVTLQESKDRITEAVDKQDKLAEQVLDQKITDADELAKYPGAAAGTSKRDLITQKAIPKLPISQKDAQAASEALAIVNELETRFKATQPTELFPSVTRWIRDNTTAVIGLETAAEGFDAFRKGRAQLLSRVLSGADTRFSAPEMIAMEDSIPSLYSRPSVAKDIFNSMRATIQNRLGTPGTSGIGPSGPAGTQAPAQLDPGQRQIIEERNKARFGKGVPPK